MRYEYVTLNPVLNMPDFYQVPDEYPTAISKDGKVYNINTGNLITVRSSIYGYLQASVNYKGIEKTYRVHRLIARTFIGRPLHLWNTPFQNLHVNHIDGNKQNNNLHNLEWCTAEENQQHAIRTGLQTFDSILAKDIRDGSIKEFNNATFCSRFFNLRDGALRQHVLSESFGTKIKDFHVFKLNNNTPWPELKNIDLSKNYNDFIQRGYWIATKINNTDEKDKIVLSDTLKNLTGALLLKFTSVNHLYKKDKINNNCFGWNIQYRDRMTDSELKSIPKRVSTSNGGREVKIINVNTNEEKIFDSKLKMSRETDIKIGTIDYYLNRDKMYNNTYMFKTI